MTDRIRVKDKFIFRKRARMVERIKKQYHSWVEGHSLARVINIETSEFKGKKRVTFLTVLKRILNLLYGVWKVSHPFRVIVGLPIVLGGMWGLPGSRATTSKIIDLVDSFFIKLTGNVWFGYALSFFFLANIYSIWFIGERLWFNSWRYVFSRKYRRKIKEEAVRENGDPFAKVYGDFAFILILFTLTALGFIIFIYI